MENFRHDMMDDLLMKYLTDEATPPEQEEVEAWISASESNRKYFRHFQMIWEESLELTVSTSVDEGRAWQKFRRHVRKEEMKKQRPTRFGWWHIAASVVLVAGAAWFTSTLFYKGTREPEIVNVIALNEVKKDTLPDGSFTTLNKHSAITYPMYFKGKSRNVKLQGEAFFDIRANKQKPFVIEVKDVQVKVVGTSFNVKSQGDSIEVIVETGIVEVTRAGNTVELKAGERTIFHGSASKAVKQVSEDKLYNYYVSRTFVCDNTPLWKLVQKLNEAYEVDIRIEKKETGRLPLTVTFDGESLDTILDIIAQTLLIKVSKDGKKIILH